MADHYYVSLRVPPTDMACRILNQLAEDLLADGADLLDESLTHLDADCVRWGSINDHVLGALAELRSTGHGYVLVESEGAGGSVDVYKPDELEYTVYTVEGTPALTYDEIVSIQADGPNAEAAIDEMLKRLTIPEDVDGWVKEPA